MQEERQRSRERAESEAECASSGHEDMPVERILEAELAVEPKTESYGDMNTENSVGVLTSPSSCHILDGARHGQGICLSLRFCPFRLLCSFFRPTTLSPIYAMLPISSFLLSLNGPSVYPTSLTSPWRTKSFCSGQVSDTKDPFFLGQALGLPFCPWDSKTSDLMELNPSKLVHPVERGYPYVRLFFCTLLTVS